jgi:hypothetical protein
MRLERFRLHASKPVPWEECLMRTKVVLTAFIAVILLGSSWLMADDPKTTGKAKGSLPANWGKLGLSDDQKKQVYSIEGEYRTKIEELQMKIDDLKKKQKAELTKVLTVAQKARLKEILASKAGDVTDDANKDKDKNK